MIGRLLWGVGVWMLVAGWATAQETAPARAAVPSAAVQKKARDLATEIFREALASAKTREERAALGKKLLQTGLAEQGDPGARYALLGLAGEQAAEAADVETAMTAAELIGTSFAVDALKLKADAVARLYGAKGLDSSALNERCTKLIEECFSADRYDLARKTAEQALSLARRDGDNQDVLAAAGRVKEVAAVQAGYEQAQKAVAAAGGAGTPAARLALGRFCCLVKGDWAKGLPLLAGASDKALKQAAEKEALNPPAAAGQVEVGDAWWDLSDKEPDLAARRKLRDHAADWYNKALPNLTGVAKLRVHLRLDEHRPPESATRWTVVFRSADPSLWNTEANAGPDQFAVPVHNVPGDIKYVRITLVSTKASVIVAAGRDDLLKDEGGSGRYRWNGSNKFEFGGNHLGAIDMEGGSGQGKVEVGYSRAGWGFGHQYEVNDRQAWAWAGAPLDKSVFEIAVTTALTLSAKEKKVLLGAGGPAGAGAMGKVHSIWRRPVDGAWFVLYHDGTYRRYDQDYATRGEARSKGAWQNDSGRIIVTSSTGSRFVFSGTGDARVVSVPPASWPQDLPQP